MRSTPWFEVRDDDLPDRPPLAVTATLPAALAEVARLQDQLFAQLAANGEGGVGLTFRLRVVEVTPGQADQLRRLESVNGHR